MNFEKKCCRNDRKRKEKCDRLVGFVRRPRIVSKLGSRYGKDFYCAKHAKSFPRESLIPMEEYIAEQVEKKFQGPVPIRINAVEQVSFLENSSQLLMDIYPWSK